MLQVKPDISKNRLYIKISGKVTKKELDTLYTDMRFCVADLQPGFDVLSDFSECKLGNLNGLPTFKKISNYLVARGVGNVVRVLPQRELIFNQIMNLASRVQGYKPTYVSTLEEAEEHLAKAAKRRGIRIRLHFHDVAYSVGHEKGQGEIVDISTSGCAIESATVLPPTDTDILTIFSLMREEGRKEQFELKARVVRSQAPCFAVEFKGLDAQRQEELWQCLAYESQQAIES